jgi:hypothetical protein
MKNFLKRSWIISLILLVWGCNSNEQTQSVKMMLKDPVQQKEIFSQIGHDSVQMRQFMQYMMQNSNDKHMMNSQHMMLGHMMHMMQNDSTYYHMFRDQMMNNEHFRGMMQNMYQKQGNMMENSNAPMHK